VTYVQVIRFELGTPIPSLMSPLSLSSHLLPGCQTMLLAHSPFPFSLLCLPMQNKPLLACFLLCLLCELLWNLFCFYSKFLGVLVSLENWVLEFPSSIGENSSFPNIFLVTLTPIKNEAWCSGIHEIVWDLVFASQNLHFGWEGYFRNGN
jgi:hypothetical protein